jgi:hypothetical protein
LAIGIKCSFVLLLALRCDPRTELVAIDGVGLRDAGITMVFDVGQAVGGDTGF